MVAHEYGHHVQNLLGVLGRAQQGAQGATGNGVRTELQADCYAGVWAHYAAITKQPGTDVTYLEPLSDKDIADALSAASSVGDDRIQKQATGRIRPRNSGPTVRRRNGRSGSPSGSDGDPSSATPSAHGSELARGQFGGDVGALGVELKNPLIGSVSGSGSG